MLILLPGGYTLINARSRFVSSSEIFVIGGAAGIPIHFFVSSNAIISKFCALRCFICMLRRSGSFHP